MQAKENLSIYFRKLGRTLLKTNFQAIIIPSFISELFPIMLMATVSRIFNADVLLSLTSGRMPTIKVQDIRMLILFAALSALITPMLKILFYRYLIIGKFKYNKELFVGPKFLAKAWLCYFIMYIFYFMASILSSGIIYAISRFINIQLLVFLLPLAYIPIIYVIIRMFPFPFIIAENKDVSLLSALKISFSLSKINRRDIFSMIIYFLLLKLLLGYVLEIFSFSYFLLVFLSQVVGLLIVTYSSVSNIVMYLYFAGNNDIVTIVNTMRSKHLNYAMKIIEEYKKDFEKEMNDIDSSKQLNDENKDNQSTKDEQEYTENVNSNNDNISQNEDDTENKA